MSSFEETLRAKLMQSGLLDRMKSLFFDAAIDVVKNDVDPSRTDARLFKPSPLLLQNFETESFALSMALIIDFLRQYNLLHTLNVLKNEVGPEVIPPQEEEETEEEIREEREALCKDLKVSTEGSALERLYEKATKPATKIENHSITEMAHKPVLQQDHFVHQTPPKQQQPSPVKDQTQQQQQSPVKNNTVAVSNAPAGAKEFSVEPIPFATEDPKKKAKETTYTVERYDGGEFVRYNQITGQPFNMEYMRNCRVLIFDAADSITMDDCENCEVVVAACENSLFIRGCKNMKLIVACKQLRTRDCQDCDIYLFTTTDPVVENSCGMHFYPFNLESPKLVDRFKSARFDAKMNRFIHVYDFTVDAKLPKEHFTVHYPDHGNTQLLRYGMATVDAADINSPPEIGMLLRGEIEPASSLERGASKSLNIKTGAGQWTGNNNNVVQNQGAAPAQQQQQQRPTTAPATTQQAPPPQQQRPATAASGVPSIAGIASANATIERNQQQAPASSSTSETSSASSTPQVRRGNNNNTSKPVAAEPAPAAKPAAKKSSAVDPNVPGDEYMLKRDSSSESSISSYEDSDFEKDSKKGSDEDDDTF